MPALIHPAEHVLRRHAANGMTLRRRRTIDAHLELCEECRAVVSKMHQLARRYRDFERLWIAREAARSEFIAPRQHPR
jgi:predicted anti-sigma-YlaC factor YlaD